MILMLFVLFLLLDVAFIVVACRTRDVLWLVLAGVDFMLLALMILLAMIAGV